MHVCAAGCVATWDVHTGRRESRFASLHKDAKLTAMSFDARQRRLLTAAADGSILLCNFNTGTLLRRFKSDGPHKEITELLYLHDAKRELDMVYAAGWSHTVMVWEEHNASVCTIVETEYVWACGHVARALLSC